MARVEQHGLRIIVVKSTELSPQSAKLTTLRWPHFVAFGLLLVGVLQLFTPHMRQVLVFYSMAASGGYNFCRPREAGQSHWEYINDPGHMAMLLLLSLGAGIYLYSLIEGHF